MYQPEGQVAVGSDWDRLYQRVAYLTGVYYWCVRWHNLFSSSSNYILFVLLHLHLLQPSPALSLTIHQFLRDPQHQLYLYLFCICIYALPTSYILPTLSTAQAVDMDPLSVLSALSAVAGLVGAVGRTLLGLSSLVTQSYSDEWKIIFADGSSYLNVFDIPFTKGVKTEMVARCKVDNPRDTTLVQSTLEGLPPQAKTSIRVYVEENLGSNNDFRSHVAQLVSKTFKKQYNSVTTNSLTRLISQYRNQTGGPSWLSGSYSFHPQIVARAYKGVELSAEKGIGISSSLLFSAGLIRTLKKVRIAVDCNGRLISKCCQNQDSHY